MKETKDTSVAEADGGFLSRWSQRKLNPQRAIEEDHFQELALDGDSEVSEEPEKSDETLLTDADMPPIESLNEDSDYSGFMSEGVSEELRQLALRKLFRSAAFNVVDGLDDYDDDYTSFEKLGDIVTCDMKFQLEREAKKKAEALLEDDAVEVGEETLDKDDIPGEQSPGPGDAEDCRDTQADESLSHQETSKENTGKL